MDIIKCQTCLRKFTLEAKPRVLEGCLHSACHFCLTKAVKYSEGKVTCGAEGCGNIEKILDPQTLPVSLRTFGKVFDPKRATKIDDSHVEYERQTGLHLDCKSNTCPLHGHIITHVNGALTSGCDKCLEDNSCDKKTVPLTKLNQILIKEINLVSGVRDLGVNMTSQLKGATRNIEKDKKLLEAEKKKVNDYFDRLHNSLELRECQVVQQIDRKQDDSLRAIDNLSESVQVLEDLLEKVDELRTNPGCEQLVGQSNLAKIIERIVEEEGKAKALLQDVATRIPPNISIDPNYHDILRSCIYVEEVKVKDDFIETPPESSTEDEADGHGILSQLKKIVVDNSVTYEASLAKTPKSFTEGAPTKRVDFDFSSSCVSTNPSPGTGIIDVDNSQDTSDSNISIDSEVEEDSTSDDNPSILTISVPRFHKIECQVLEVSSPSNITVMSSEDKAAFHRLQEDINNHFKLRENRSSLDVTSLEDGTPVCVKTNNGWVRAVLVKTDDQAHLDLIDLGHVCLLNEVYDVRHLATQFLKVPPLAFTVKLDNLVPVGNGDQWSSHAKDKLNQLIEGATAVEIEVVDGKDEGPYLANMCTKVIRNDDPMSPDVLEEFNVADVLLEEGLAMTTSSLKKAIVKPQDVPDRFFTWRRAKPLVKEKFQCKVEWLDEECNFHVSPLEWKEDRDRVQSLVGANFFRKLEEIPHANRVWRKGEACIARYPLDNIWYRAEIVVPHVDSNHVGVEFVDFGTQSSVLRIHVSDNIMDTVKDIPILCFPVQLDVKPLTSKWETEILDKIHLKVEGQVLDVSVKLYGNPFPFIVDMFMGEDESKEDLEKFVIGSGMGKKGYRERMRL